MEPNPAPEEVQQDRPSEMLRSSNSNLRRDKIFTFSLPALSAEVDGRTISTCPMAGKCAEICYALVGSYTWPVVAAAHNRNLAFVVQDLPGWEAAMTAELTKRKFVGANVRIHDAGDFFSDEYLLAWLRIIRASPKTFFYTYTKEVLRFQRLVESGRPANFRFVYSKGGRQDALLKPGDRTADVFPAEADIAKAGHHSQEASDLLAVTGPAPVGMRANTQAQARKLQGRTLGEWQAEDKRPPKTRQ